MGFLLWLITTGVPSVMRCYKGIEGEDWESHIFFVQRKELGPVGSEEATGGPKKAKALWKMKAAKDAGERITTTPRVRKASKEETRQD